MAQSARRSAPSDETDSTITGPHLGYDASSGDSYRYWRCENCDLETTDSRVNTEGCFRCNSE